MNYKEVVVISENMENIINCEEVFQEFRFRMAVFLFSENNDTKLLHHYLTKMMNLEDATMGTA